ncbi:hypothetical protein [Verrucomicrobium spinosum]|uniref:hypothetical protein n=1 Tax=Verrucomicrobium spinosum TaxID=2736 RepID=UPI0012E26F0B|nr:hypothetical protein [Verrucomicrobium spinosum]
MADFNGLQRNLGVALRYLTTDGKAQVYNAQEAPRQQLFPHHLLERFNVYPLYAGRHCVYLLSETPDNYAFEDEWLSLGNEAGKIILCWRIQQPSGRPSHAPPPTSIPTRWRRSRKLTWLSGRKVMWWRSARRTWGG